MKPALGQNFEAGIAALLGPFVKLFGQDGANHPDQGGAIGKASTPGRRACGD
jgi:hypothetical protein